MKQFAQNKLSDKESNCKVSFQESLTVSDSKIFGTCEKNIKKNKHSSSNKVCIGSLSINIYIDLILYNNVLMSVFFAF